MRTPLNTIVNILKLIESKAMGESDETFMT